MPINFELLSIEWKCGDHVEVDESEAEEEEEIYNTPKNESTIARDIDVEPFYVNKHIHRTTRTKSWAELMLVSQTSSSIIIV